MNYSARLERLRACLFQSSEPKTQVLDCAVIGSIPNIRYLTGFTGSAGILLLDLRRTIFYTDGRYALQAPEEVRTAEVRVPGSGAHKALFTYLKKCRHRRIGFEETCHYSFYRRLAEVVGPRRLLPLGGVVEKLRLVKEEAEINAIRSAVEMNSRVLAQVLPLVRSGIREKELAAELDYRMLRLGGDRPAFETIVASGSRAALPHARPSRRALANNEFVLFDLGVILAGYSSDMTRTVYLGSADRRARRVYAVVREALERAREVVRAGVSAARIDRAARGHIQARGYGRFFNHSTGHGLGLEVHEMPRLAARERLTLPAGAVITLEPGIYLPGFGGVRIEDVVVVRPKGCETLTPTSRELVML